MRIREVIVGQPSMTHCANYGDIGHQFKSQLIKPRFNIKSRGWLIWPIIPQPNQVEAPQRFNYTPFKEHILGPSASTYWPEITCGKEKTYIERPLFCLVESQVFLHCERGRGPHTPSWSVENCINNKNSSR